MVEFLQYLTKISVLLARIFMSTIRRNGHVTGGSEKRCNVMQDLNGVKSIRTTRIFFLCSTICSWLSVFRPVGADLLAVHVTVTIETREVISQYFLHVLKTCTSVSVNYQNKSLIYSIFRALIRCIRCINEQQIHFNFTDVLLLQHFHQHVSARSGHLQGDASDRRKKL